MNVMFEILKEIKEVIVPSGLLVTNLNQQFTQGNERKTNILPLSGWQIFTMDNIHVWWGYGEKETSIFIWECKFIQL